MTIDCGSCVVRSWRFGDEENLPAHAAKLPHAGCALVPISSPKIFSELLLVRPNRVGPSPEMDTLIALIAERAAGI